MAEQKIDANIYRAKRARTRPARPAPATWTWFELAAPVEEEEAAEPDAVAEPVGWDAVPEAAREAPWVTCQHLHNHKSRSSNAPECNYTNALRGLRLCNTKRAHYLPDEAADWAAPVALAPALGAPDWLAPADPTAGTATVWLLGKKLAMQLWTH
jgi:hypothetical protein